MDNKQHEEPHESPLTNIGDGEFVDPEKLTDTEYATAQLDMWSRPAAINLTTTITKELNINEDIKSFRTDQMNMWKSRLIELMKNESLLSRSISEGNRYKLLFNEAYSRSSTSEQQQALSIIERLALVASGSIVTKRNMYPTDKIVALIHRVLDD